MLDGRWPHKKLRPLIRMYLILLGVEPITSPEAPVGRTVLVAVDPIIRQVVLGYMLPVVFIAPENILVIYQLNLYPL